MSKLTKTEAPKPAPASEKPAANPVALDVQAENEALKAELAALKAAKPVVEQKAKPAPVVDDEAPSPGLYAKLKEYGRSMTQHPIFGAMFTEARDASALATRNRIGKAMNTTIRTKVLAPMLPTHMQVMLKLPFVAALVDFVLSNAIMALVIVFGDKLPGRMGEITLTIARCTTTSAYVEGLDLINVEELFNKAFDKDLLALAKEAADKGV